MQCSLDTRFTRVDDDYIIVSWPDPALQGGAREGSGARLDDDGYKITRVNR